MKHLILQGQSIPALGLGTWRLVDDECRVIVERALQLGYRHIDTARRYGNEAEVGASLSESRVARDQIYLTTKLWFDELEPDSVRPATEDSLEQLRTDYVDLLLIHWPSREVPVEATLDAMLELKQEGRIRGLGVSNFPSQLVERAAAHAPGLVCNQVEYHPFLDQRPVLETCRRREMMATAYSPLANGRVIGDPTLKRIGNGHGKNAAQVALRWLVDQPMVSAIPRTSKLEHLASNFDIFDFELTDRERDEIDELTGDHRVIDPEWAPDWD